MPVHKLSISQSDAIENGVAVLHACIEGAIARLEEAGEGKVAFGLQNARRNYEQALEAIWDSPVDVAQGAKVLV